jgi:hypothetical protein
MKKRLSVLFMLLASLIFTMTALAEEKATKDECVAMCKKAAQVGLDQGVDELLRQANDPKGPFVWKDTYIFIANLDTNQVVAHPIRAGLVGKDMSGIKDINGKMFYIETLNIAREKGEGWIDYMWPKPGEKAPSSKSSYVYRLPGLPYALIAGVYN